MQKLNSKNTYVQYEISIKQEGRVSVQPQFRKCVLGNSNFSPLWTYPRMIAIAQVLILALQMNFRKDANLQK